MTSTYTLERNPWCTPQSEVLRKRIDKEVNARSLAHTTVDLLGVVAAYAGQNYDGMQKTNLFPGRALVTPRSDPARSVRYRRSNWSTRDEHSRFDLGAEELESGEQQQQQPQHFSSATSSSRRSPNRFEYDNMAELRDNDNNNNNTTSAASRGSSALDMFQRQQAELRARRFQKRAQTPNATSTRYAEEAQQQQNGEEGGDVADEERQQQQQYVQHRGTADPLLEAFGLRLPNSKRDLDRARECRYGLRPSGGGKRGSVVESTPIDYRLYPNRKTRDEHTHDKPLVMTDRGFVRAGAAHGAFPKARLAEIQGSMTERRGTRSAVLTKALEELKHQDQALLVHVPWYYSNHKNAQSAFLGGGVAEASKPDFLLRFALDAPEYALPDFADGEQEQEPQTK